MGGQTEFHVPYHPGTTPDDPQCLTLSPSSEEVGGAWTASGSVVGRFGGTTCPGVLDRGPQKLSPEDLVVGAAPPGKGRLPRLYL